MTGKAHSKKGMTRAATVGQLISEMRGVNEGKWDYNAEPFAGFAHVLAEDAGRMTQALRSADPHVEFFGKLLAAEYADIEKGTQSIDMDQRSLWPLLFVMRKIGELQVMLQLLQSPITQAAITEYVARSGRAQGRTKQAERKKGLDLEIDHGLSRLKRSARQLGALHGTGGGQALKWKINDNKPVSASRIEKAVNDARRARRAQTVTE